MLFPLKVPTSGEKSTKEEAPKVLMADDPVQPPSTVTWYERGFFSFTYNLHFQGQICTKMTKNPTHTSFWKKVI